MTIITLSWQLGIEGERIGELVGEPLGPPVVNRQIVKAIMRALRVQAAAAEATERMVPRWQIEMSVGLSEWFGVACVLVGRGGSRPWPTTRARAT